MTNLIFPSFHIKDNLHDKSVSIFFMAHHVAPLTLFSHNQYEEIDINQMLKFTYDAVFFLYNKVL
jgi:hypothetical protein